MFDYEDVYKQAQWLAIFEEVLMPLDEMEDSEFSIIAPHQSNKIVRSALMVSLRGVAVKLCSIRNPNGTELKSTRSLPWKLT